MKRLFKITALIICLCATGFAAAGQTAGNSDKTIETKAELFFHNREWASAQALYSLILDRQPDRDSIYVYAIVSAAMLKHNDIASHYLTQAMKAGVAFSPLMHGVENVSFEIGAPKLYEDFLIRSQKDCPWLTRPLDAELLRYYLFRNNGAKAEIYARKMLAGMPQSVEYLSDLAKSYADSGDFDSAVETWQRILEIEPDNYPTLLQLGNYYKIISSDEEATRYLGLAAAIRRTPYVDRTLKAFDRIEKNH